MLEYIMTHAGDLLQIATAVVTAAALIAALTPSPKDDGVVAKARTIIDLLALNFGHAKNAPKQPASSDA